MLTIEETIDRLNHLYLEDNLEDDYIDRIRNQQHLLLKIVANSPLSSSIDISIINTVYDQVVLSVQAFMRPTIRLAIRCCTSSWRSWVLSTTTISEVSAHTTL